MRYNKILTIFSVLLPLSVILRIFQLIFTVDTKTGFFLREYEKSGGIMLGGILIFALAAALFPLISHRSPDHAPEINIFLTVSSFLLAFSILLELFTESFPVTVQLWLVIILRITGLASAAFFVCLGLSKIASVNIPPLLFIVPLIYLLVRIICDFTAISALALISDNFILMAAYCSCLWFMLNFAKLYNGIDTDYNSRKLMSSSMLASLLCFTQSVPHLLINSVTKNSYMHTSFQVNFNVLLMGVFILCFMLSHFSKKNLS